MVGFSLVHAFPGLFLLMLLSALLACVFLLAATVYVVAVFARQRHLAVGWVGFVPAAVLLVCIGLLFVPYSFWKLALVVIVGPGDHAVEHLAEAAALGELRLVRALLEKGVAVDNMNSFGTTALNGACVAGQLQTARYLMSKGADVQRAPDCKFVPALTGKPPYPRIPGTTIEVR